MMLIMFSKSVFPKLLKGHNSSGANQDDCSVWAAATNTTSPLVPMETALRGEMLPGGLTRGKKSLCECLYRESVMSVMSYLIERRCVMAIEMNIFNTCE